MVSSDSPHTFSSYWEAIVLRFRFLTGETLAGAEGSVGGNNGEVEFLSTFVAVEILGDVID